MKSNKELTSDIIAEGIDKSIYGTTLKVIIYAFIVFVLLSGIIMCVGLYKSWKWNQENCINGDCSISTQKIQECNYPYVSCRIYAYGSYYMCNGSISTVVIEANRSNIESVSFGNNPCVDVSSQIPLTQSELCGYQEANAWFEQFKNNHQEYYQGYSKLKMECR